MNFFWSYIKQVMGGYGLLYNWWATQEQIASIEYGYLYNGYAASGGTFISGWHLPSNTEAFALQAELGGESVAGGKMKETGTTYWLTPNTGADNSSGWNGRGSSERSNSSGAFGTLKQSASYWLSNISGGTQWRMGDLSSASAIFPVNSLTGRSQGYSIRLIKDDSTDPGFVDIDGHRYETVTIGTQVWMAENLMAKRYADGTSIPEVTSNSSWAALTTGARCSYDNTESNAGTTTKITSSDDWVVPTRAQYLTLQNYVGVNGGYKLKETGFTYWDNPNSGATNELGFNARGSGFRESNGSFNNLKTSHNAIESTVYQTDYYYYTNLRYDGVGFTTQTLVNLKTYGYALRLLYTGAGTPTSYTGNDGKVYPVVLIGTQYWVAANLAETKWRDGSWIYGFNGGTYTPIANTTWAALTVAATCAYNDDTNNI